MVVEDLYNKISEGELKPGEKLPGEVALSESLGVGRPTIREAIGQLIGLGLVSRGSYGLYVANTSNSAVKARLAPLLLETWEIRELYEARVIIETEIAVLACLRVKAQQLKNLHDINEKMLEKSGDEDSYWILDDEFHELVAEISDNKILITMHQSIRDMFKKYEVSINKLESIRNQTYSWHASLIEAFSRKDTSAVRKVLYESLFESQKALTILRKDKAGNQS